MPNLASVHEAIAAAIPERECLVFRDRRLSWARFTERTRRLADSDLRSFQPEIRIRKRRVAQAKPEWKERLDRIEEISAPRRRLVVVIRRHMSHRSRDGDGQPPPGIDVAEQHLGDCPS